MKMFEDKNRPVKIKNLRLRFARGRCVPSWVVFFEGGHSVTGNFLEKSQIMTSYHSDVSISKGLGHVLVFCCWKGVKQKWH